MASTTLYFTRTSYEYELRVEEVGATWRGYLRHLSGGSWSPSGEFASSESAQRETCAEARRRAGLPSDPIDSMDPCDAGGSWTRGQTIKVMQ